tara:strand:+ start:1906 stop:3990 length:2085 start_codon:yes stop_codon:yes gene_type:complete
MHRHPLYNRRVEDRKVLSLASSNPPREEDHDLYPTPYIIIDEKYWIRYANAAAFREIDPDLLTGNNSTNRVNLLRYIKRGTTEFLDWIDSTTDSPLELRILCQNTARSCLLYKRSISEKDKALIHLNILIVDSQNFADADFNTHRLVFTNTQQAIYVADNNGKITAVNPAFCRMFKYAEQQLIGYNEESLYDTATNSQRRDEIKLNLDQWGTWTGRVVNICKDGQAIHTSLHSSIVNKENSDDYFVVNIIDDISKQLELELQLKESAEIDSLTGLHNRLAFNHYFTETFAEAQRNAEKLNLLFIDLDKFKELNDQFGHDYGDELLVNVSRRLQNTLKDSDFIARLGGDEFVVILRGEMQKETLASVGEKLIKALANPFKLKDLTYQCTSSIGIARYPEDALTAEALLQAADSAMYLSKNAGRNCCCFYNEEAQKQFHSLAEQRREIGNALEEGNIKTFFQPIHNLLTGKVIAYEALARWIYNEDEIRTPASFLPIIENDTLMIKLGKQVVTQVYQLAGILDRMNSSTEISMNMSAIQLRSEQLISHIESLFEKKGRDFCNHIHVEIAEPLVFDHDPVIIQNLQRLTDIGFHLTLDNFGKGNSSIYTLKRIEFTTVKIDGIFLESIGREESQDAQILTGLIQLLHNLNVRIICEGVESQEYVHFLLDRGCILAQGWLFSEALPKEKVLQYHRKFA